MRDVDPAGRLSGASALAEGGSLPCRRLPAHSGPPRPYQRYPGHPCSRAIQWDTSDAWYPTASGGWWVNTSEDGRSPCGLVPQDVALDGEEA
jgi:hypothetical protein